MSLFWENSEPANTRPLFWEKPKVLKHLDWLVEQLKSRDHILDANRFVMSQPRQLGKSSMTNLWANLYK